MTTSSYGAPRGTSSKVGGSTRNFSAREVTSPSAVAMMLPFESKKLRCVSQLDGKSSWTAFQRFEYTLPRDKVIVCHLGMFKAMSAILFFHWRKGHAANNPTYCRT